MPAIRRCAGSGRVPRSAFRAVLEVFVTYGFAGGHAHVTSGIERPALRLNFPKLSKNSLRAGRCAREEAPQRYFLAADANAII